MAHNRMTLMASTAALALALGLAACGGSSQDTASTSNATPAATEAPTTYEATLEPKLVEPGWLDADNTSDLWWPDGVADSGDAIYFTNAANDAGMDVTFVDAAGTEDSVWDLVVEDGHLKTPDDLEEGKRAVDFTFQGNFTCYDAVSDTVYIRGDRTQEEYDALLLGKAFVQNPDDPEEVMLTFEEDGVVVQRQSGYDPLEGTWEVVSTNVVNCSFATDSSEWTNQYRFVIGEGDTIAELDSGGLKPLQYYEG